MNYDFNPLWWHQNHLSFDKETLIKASELKFKHLWNFHNLLEGSRKVYINQVVTQIVQCGAKLLQKPSRYLSISGHLYVFRYLLVPGRVVCCWQFLAQSTSCSGQSHLTPQPSFMDHRIMILMSYPWKDIHQLFYDGEKSL